MKLLRCYIENYGKLHEFSYDFNDKLNTILQENGWGKSTFASFIKSMLFGLSSTTKRDLTQNERAKYTPWQNGVFGGWIEFSLGESAYRIERTFGETKSKDKTQIFDLSTNQIIDDENFVENKLGINSDTFMRSTFVEQGVFSSASDESIKARLGKLLQDDSSFNLATVDKKLLEKQTEFKHLKGRGGKICALEDELEQTRQNIINSNRDRAQIKVLSQSLEKISTTIELINQQIKILRETQDRINEQKAQQGMREYYQNLLDDLEKAKAKFVELKATFRTTPPTAEQLNKYNSLQQKYTQLKNQYEVFDTNSEAQKFSELKSYFANGVPSEEEIKHATELNKRLHAETYSENLRTNYTQPQNSTRTSGIIFASLGGILSILAIIFGFASSRLILGTALLVLGLGMLGIGLYHIFKKSDILFFKDSSFDNEIHEIQRELVQFVSKFHEDVDHLDDALYNIRYKVQQYHDFEKNSEKLLTQKDDLLHEIQQKYDELEKIYSVFLSDTTDFDKCNETLNSMCRELDYAEKNIADKQQKIEEFKQKQQIPEDTETPLHTDSDTAILRTQIVEQEDKKTELTEQQNRLKSQIYTLGRSADLLEYYTNKELALHEQLQEANEKWQIIKLTREMLFRAKDNLTSKYLAPLCDAFTSFSTELLGKSFDGVSIDTDLNVLIEAQGSKKDTKYFSQGIRDTIELCLRLALGKVLFENEMPPLILDDPFYNLDDKKMANARKLLDNLSEKTQIIYLACHSSRA